MKAKYINFNNDDKIFHESIYESILKEEKQKEKLNVSKVLDKNKIIPKIKVSILSKKNKPENIYSKILKNLK